MSADRNRLRDKFNHLLYYQVCEQPELNRKYSRDDLSALHLGSETKLYYFNRMINPNDPKGVFPAYEIAPLANTLDTDAFAEFMAECRDGFFTKNPFGDPSKMPMAAHISYLLQSVGKVTADLLAAMSPTSEGGEEITREEAKPIKKGLNDIKSIIATIESLLP